MLAYCGGYDKFHRLVWTRRIANLKILKVRKGWQYRFLSAQGFISKASVETPIFWTDLVCSLGRSGGPRLQKACARSTSGCRLAAKEPHGAGKSIRRCRVDFTDPAIAHAGRDANRAAQHAAASPLPQPRWSNPGN